METAELRTRRAEIGGYERRSAERYEGRLEPEAKADQRDAVAEWLTQHHRPKERMRLLSLPDRYWTFENRMNERPGTSFVGLQRDWRTLELSVPWMPLSDEYPKWATGRRACHFRAEAVTGEVQGYRKGWSVICHMWAGHLLAWDNFGSKSDREGTLWTGNFRRVTAAWLDFTGYLTDEVIAATAGVPTLLGGRSHKRPYPVVTTFLGGRDNFSDHEERVTHFLVGLQKAQSPYKKHRGWRYRFDRFSVHAGTSPFVSVFGSYRFYR